MLKHGFIGPMRPEQFPKPFVIYGGSSATTTTGRIKQTDREVKGTVKCILSVAKPDEIERFSQIGVRVTHKIIQRGVPIAKEHDVFALKKGTTETRFFEVTAVHNKGELDIDTTYYCEERSDRREH